MKIIKGWLIVHTALTLIAVVILASFAFAPQQHQNEIEEVRNYVAESFGYPPVHLNDTLSIVRVQKHWRDEVKVHLDNGHTLKIKVELESY